MKRNGVNQVKRYIKLLATLTDPKQQSIIIKRSPDSVIKTICNAALNAQKGDIKISPQVKKKFAARRKLFNQLVSKKISIQKKRKYLNQRGGFAILPLLLSTVLSSVGSLLFEKLVK